MKKTIVLDLCAPLKFLLEPTIGRAKFVIKQNSEFPTQCDSSLFTLLNNNPNGSQFSSYDISLW